MPLPMGEVAAVRLTERAERRKNMAMTRSEVVEMLDILKKCKKSILSGEAASYTVGTRSVTFLSLEEVNAEIRNYQDMLDVIDGARRARGVRVVIPYDL